MSWFGRHPAHAPPQYRPVVICDLPVPSRVRIDTAGQTFRTITTTSGRAEFPSIPIEATTASLFITKVDDEQAGAPGYAWYGETITMPASPNNDWWAIPIPAAYTRPLPATWVQLPKLLVPTGLSALVVHGQVFQQADGTPWTAIDSSSFQAVEKCLTGQDLTAVFGQLRDVGFNMIRVFGMCRNLFDLNPTHFPNFYDRLPALLHAAAAYGLRTNFVVFPDCALVMPRLEDQLAHWQRIGDALRPVASSCLVSLVNEVEQTPNQMNTDAFAPLAGLLCSHGSHGSRQAPVRPWWDFEEYHTNNEPQFWREPHNGMEFSQGAEGIVASGVPMLITENRRPDLDPVASHFGDAAECAALLVAGSCFHSIPGRTSDLLSGHDLECARAWVAGVKRIALACQGGAYTHRLDLERPDAGTTGERAYQRGSDEACIAHSLQ